MKEYLAGVDIGSTTVKLVLLDERRQMVFGEYRRHCAHIQESLLALLEQAQEQLGDGALRMRLTGSGAMTLANALGVGFVQEVVAVSSVRVRAPLLAMVPVRTVPELSTKTLAASTSASAAVTAVTSW